jgi:hypothetical protein
LAALPSGIAAQAVPVALDDYLRATIKLNDRELADAHSGRAVSKLLPTENSRDVAVFGIVALHMTREQYLARFADPRAFAARGASSFGLIGDDVNAADFAPISVDESEYRAFRDCKVSDCKFKLPVSVMRQVADDVSWKAPNAKRQVDSLVRSDLQRLVARYRASGNDAMPHYDDTHGTWGRDAFDSLLAQAALLRQRAPELRDYLDQYPQRRPADVRDVFYWSIGRIPHMRPTLMIGHLVLYTPQGGTPMVARKMLYANHYFEGALEVLAIEDGPFGGESPGIYLATVREYRFDNLPGGIFNIRGRVRDRLVNLVREDLERELLQQRSP